MIISLTNCNNISAGSLTIDENKLNIKYAINGTGKSTLAKALYSSATNDNDTLAGLTPYAHIGSTDPQKLPSISGLPSDTQIAVFDEEYVNRYVFLEDELIKNSFDIFVKTENYERQINEINCLVGSIRTMFEKHPELDALVTDMHEFISVYGRATRTGIANNGSLVKGLGGGNLIHNIPNDLEDYSVFLTNEKNVKWLKWQSDGQSYLSMDTKCPFCATELGPRRKKIERIKEEYDAKTVEHLSKILDLFDRLGQYFSEDTNARVKEITSNVNGLTEDQKRYLVLIKEDVDVFYQKLLSLKSIGFDSLKHIDKISSVLKNYKIELQYLPHLNTEYTMQKVKLINNSIEDLQNVIGNLQAAINKQKQEIAKTIRLFSTEINSFLSNAGYSYTVSIDEDIDHSYKLKLKFGTSNSEVIGAKKHLSYGERNAFALVLFMYSALHDHANLIILDDPISSFDKNKKFAILDMLFIHGKSFRGKTVLLLTHDFEPVIDSIYNHPAFFDRIPYAAFLENNNGLLQEIEIKKEDILSSVQIAKENIICYSNPISQLIYLRRLIEITEGKTDAWHLLSNILHNRTIPIIGDTIMDQNILEAAIQNIKKIIPDFDYEACMSIVGNQEALIQTYHSVHSKYEKLHIYRMLLDPKKEVHVVRKFINEAYHTENDYLFQLNPLKYNTIPAYIIRECDAGINELEASLS